MPRVRENRYLPTSRDSVRPRAAYAVDLAADKDNFRDSEDQIGGLVTCTLAYT
jgi:hypothetical protein